MGRLLFVVFLVFLCACNDSSSGAGGSAPVCAPVSGQAWVPRVGNASAHDPTTQLSEETLRVSVSLRGLLEAPATVDVPFTIPADLGDGGSLSLVGEVENFPSDLQGGAHPMLVSISDGAGDWISLAPGPGANCGSGGFFCCSGANCELNPLWKVSGAYGDPLLWEDHQISPFGFLSVNTFPNCRWGDGEAPTDSRTRCFFGDDTRFPGGKPKAGRYVARYALILSDYERNPAPNSSATLKVTLLRKQKQQLESGAIDLNVILVGNRNIQDSRTPEGARNLDAVLEMIRTRYAGAGASGLPIGRVQVFEWSCEQGGEAFAQVSVDQLGTLFAQGSGLLPASAGHALNLFMVSNLLSSDARVTLLGVSGGIGGPLIAGTAESGLAFASFGKLAAFTSDAPELRELGETISHEMGHFLGLSHPSEADGVHHDPVPDTPICTRTDPFTGIQVITHRSCRDLDTENHWNVSGRTCLQACPSYDGKTQFCPDAAECQFNHLMWWTAKNWSASGGANEGDGSLISPQSDRVIRFSPAVQ